MAKHRTYLSGFTLVELSISLVIIGLLAGGVLIGRDLIKIAQVRGFITRVDQFRTAADSFRLKYRGLPGDLSPGQANSYGFETRAGSAGRGDANGIIEGCAVGSTALGCETALFWRDLTESKLTNTKVNIATDSIIDGSVAGFSIDDYLPHSPQRDNIRFMIYARAARNAFYISNITAVSNLGVLSTAAALSPQESYAIDEKMDDAVPDQGVIQALVDMQTQDPGAVAATGVCVLNTVPPTYNAATDFSDSIACQLGIFTGM
jgi:prepilin-type N-terminal cleavage/methylation domain-containing protein